MSSVQILYVEEPRSRTYVGQVGLKLQPASSLFSLLLQEFWIENLICILWKEQCRVDTSRFVDTASKYEFAMVEDVQLIKIFFLGGWMAKTFGEIFEMMQGRGNKDMPDT